MVLPDTLTKTTQKEIRAATDLLGPSLEKSVKADGNWRYNQEWFKQGSENVGSTPGCINLSPAWFQQGHENLSDPEVSASLKGPSSKRISSKLLQGRQPSHGGTQGHASSAVLCRVTSLVTPRR
ncbi:hypothetical protein BDR07DRAFT_1500799 [Suillus spraguei]|nr:hypothetical protein BDR07DRAFT_1500799 [Suillus spraguei]